MRCVSSGVNPDVPNLAGESPLYLVLTSGDIDHLGGLLSLREETKFDLYAPAPVLDLIAQSPVFDVLDPERVSKHSLPPHREIRLPGGLNVRAFPVPGKPPLYMETGTPETNTSRDFTVGLRLGDGNGNSIAYIPACAAVDKSVHTMIGSIDALFFDGTLWTDDELVVAGVGLKTGRRMGHISISGPEGSIAALKDVSCGERFFVHINNTNPLNCNTSAERKIAEASGWRIPEDGLEISL